MLVAGGIAWFVEVRREGEERQRYPAPGLVIADEGRRLHVYCQGTVQAGVPPVVLEAGAGDSHLAWAAVQAELAPYTRVCSYDRPGYGWSDGIPGPHTADRTAQALPGLLSRAGIAGPYLLVGQGLGSVVVYRFGQLHPEAVAGLVFVSPPDTGALVIQPAPVRAAMVEVERLPALLARAIAPFGGMRWLVRAGVVGDHGALPEAVQAPARALTYRSQTWRTALAERGAMGENALALAGGPALPTVPVTVIMPAGENAPFFVPDATLVSASMDEDDLHVVRPALIVDAVLEMLAGGR